MREHPSTPPKYIDLHTHGLSGLDSHSTRPDEYLRLAETYALHGTAAFLPTLFPGPIDTMRSQLAAIRKARETQASSGSGAKILGAHIEGPFVNPLKCGALPKESFLLPTEDNIARLLDGFEDIVRIITIAPELPGALRAIGKFTGAGIRVNMGHSDATAEQARDGQVAGATGVTHLFNAMSGIHHREPGLAGFALTHDSLFVEVIADFAHIHPDMLKVVLRCKPADRIILVSDSLLEAKLPSSPPKGPLYVPGTATLAGSGISLADAVSNIISLGIPEETALGFAIDNPANYLRTTLDNI
jgi:N-acetylglucosamine-6-phosphate deacetylase